MDIVHRTIRITTARTIVVRRVHMPVSILVGHVSIRTLMYLP